MSKGDNFSEEEGQASLIGIREEGREGTYRISIQKMVCPSGIIINEHQKMKCSSFSIFWREQR
jgi:hypothetical protein